MFEDVLGGSRTVSLVEEETADDLSSHKMVVRVKDRKRWGRMVLSLLHAPEEAEDSFGVSVRKEYYLEQESGKPAFCWVVLLWGDLDVAKETLTSIFSSVATQPDVVLPTVPSFAKGYASIVKRVSTPDKTETVVRLPHRATVRNIRPSGPGGKEKTKRIGDTEGRAAFVDSIAGDEGEPWL